MENLIARVKKISDKYPKIKKIIGIVLIILGFLALITPLTPGSWLIFIGVELLGFRMAIWEKLKNKFFNVRK